MSHSTDRFIPVAAPLLGAREEQYVLEALRSGWVSSAGPFLQRFEQEFARYLGVEHAVSVSNGTVALHLLLHALGIGPGDEVIVPDLTFVATAHAALQAGATPVLADVEPDTWCLSPAAVARAVTPRTKAIIAVHLYGHPADMAGLEAIAAQSGAVLLEDAAEAHGARIGTKRVGGLGRAGAFSFYGNKLLTTGEGGMVVTRDGPLAERLRYLKDHGMSAQRRYFHTELAFNYRMTNLQAALGLAQLERLDEFIERKRQIFGWYRELLAGHPALALNAERAGYENVYWMTSVVLQGTHAQRRDQICESMKADGVDSRPFFVAMSELPHLRALKQVGAAGEGCPVAAGLSRAGINLPSGCALDRESVARVARALERALEREA